MALHVPKAPGFLQMLKEGARVRISFRIAHQSYMCYIYSNLTFSIILVLKKQYIVTLMLVRSSHNQ